MSTNTDEIMNDAEVKAFVENLPKTERVKVKTSWKRFFRFAGYAGGLQNGERVVQGWLTSHPEETRFHIAVKKVLKQFPELQSAFNQKVEDIELDHCTTMPARVGDPDSPKIIVRDEKGQLCFTVEQTKAKRNAINEQSVKEDMEIEAHYTLEVPADLSEDEREIFTGFVIKPEE